MCIKHRNKVFESKKLSKFRSAGYFGASTG